eukprot:SAG31_NODE_22158_length_532_cov_1.161663_1_plen_88_part_00
MIQQICLDIVWYLAILLIILLGSTLFFVINIGDRDAFSLQHGAVWPLITVFRAMLGDFDVDGSLPDRAVPMTVYILFQIGTVILMYA